jgi:trehalose 6-phosphate synthase
MPPPEVLTSMPNHEQLIPLLLQYDVVGFQTDGDAGNFVRYVIAENQDARREMLVFETSDRRIALKLNGRQTQIGSFPVGIEPRSFERLARRNVQSPLVKDLAASLGERALVIGVDRLDYSKGLLPRLEAFEKFLARNPDWQGNVTYLQITPKNRSDIPEYLELAQAVDYLAGRINGKYGEVSWTPIRYVNRVYSRSVLAGLYRTARVGLVTPLRDGMNLVNPYDTESVAGAIAQALTMPLQKRRERHAALLCANLENNVNRWQMDFLDALRGGVPTEAEVRDIILDRAPQRGSRVTTASSETAIRRGDPANVARVTG